MKTEVVAQTLGKVCRGGCRDLKFVENRRLIEIAGTRVAEGDWISLDGETGEVMLGRLEIVSELPKAELAVIDSWRRVSD